MFHHLARLIIHFCQFPISPSTTRQRVEQPKSKSNQPNYLTRWTTLNIQFRKIFLKQLEVMNQVFECPGNNRLTSCSCPNGLAEAPVPALCLDRSNNQAVFGKKCDCRDGSDPTVRRNA